MNDDITYDDYHLISFKISSISFEFHFIWIFIRIFSCDMIIAERLGKSTIFPQNIFLIGQILLLKL